MLSILQIKWELFFMRTKRGGQYWSVGVPCGPGWGRKHVLSMRFHPYREEGTQYEAFTDYLWEGK